MQRLPAYPSYCTLSPCERLTLTLSNKRASIKLDRTHLQCKEVAFVISIDYRRIHDRSKRLQPPGDRGVPRGQGEARWALGRQALAPTHHHGRQELPAPHNAHDVHSRW